MICQLLGVQGSGAPPTDASFSRRWLTTASDRDLADLFVAIRAHLVASVDLNERLLGAIFRFLVDCQRRRSQPLETPLRDALLELYQQLGSACTVRWSLLQWLAAAGGSEDVKGLVERIIEDPPLDRRAIRSGRENSIGVT